MRILESASGDFGREHAIHVERFSYAFEILEAEVPKIKSRRCETPRRFRDEYRIFKGKRLQTRGNIRRLSHRVHRPRITISNFTDNNRARANTHATSQGNRPWNLRDRGDNFQGGVNSTTATILMRIGPTEKCHRAIAQEAGDLASKALNCRAARLSIRVNQFSEFLWIHLLRELRRSHQVAEH